MILEMKIPNTGAAKKDILLANWDVEDGDEVSQGDIIGEIETAKSNMEIEAEKDGYIKLVAEEDEYYNVGDVICAIADSEEELEGYEAGDSAGPSASAEEEAAEAPGMEVIKTISYKGITKTIGDLLHDSSQGTAPVTVVATADITNLLAYVKEIKDDLGVDRVKVNTYFMMLTAKALEDYPIFNSVSDENAITLFKPINMGMSVMSGGYLKVPVIKNIAGMSFKEVNDAVDSLISRANDNKLEEEDFADGTFTISNGGRNEVEIVTPIINRPQNAILGFGKVGPKALVVDGEVVARTAVTLCLTFDHKVIDGAVAGFFAGRVKELIEDKAQFSKILK